MEPPLTRPPVEIPQLSRAPRPGFKREMDIIASPPPGGNTVKLPFTIKETSPDLTTPKVKVLYGTVMDIAPTGVGVDISLGSSATTTIYIENTLDTDGNVIASVLQSTTGSLPASDEDTAILLVGTVVVSGGAVQDINQSLYFSQGFSCCGRDPSDPATTPGLYEFFVR